MILNTPEQIREYTARGWWGSDTLYDLFERNARATPDVLAVVDPPNRAELTSGTPLRLTYAELAQMVARLASGLLDAGIGKDDVLMVQLPNIVELVAVYLACARIGAVVSPLPVQYRRHELKQVLALAEPKAFITTNNFGGFNYVEMVRGLQPDFPSLQTLIANGDNLPPDVRSLEAMLTSAHNEARLHAYIGAHRVDANDTFTLCWTSGAEAEPKGVPRSHNLWVMVAYVTVDGAMLARGSTLLNPFPLVNMSGIGGMLVPWLLTGGKLVLHHPLNLACSSHRSKASRRTTRSRRPYC